VTDEKLVGGKGSGNGEEPEEPVELIYNEPLLLYDESPATIREQEYRQFDSELPGIRLTYTETKNGISYDISYYFENDKMSSASVLFDFDLNILNNLIEGLSDNYKVVSEADMTFYNEEYNKQIKIDSNPSDNYISVDY